ncbi:MAG: autotransporter-associated beta strand repeat-containing protein [Planctomycetes bacterium]|nr:autotransporter-associated beta strand repeat-containing protein [Planctomycetota bacterium]
MVLFELRTYTLYVGKMGEAIQHYTELGWPALQKGGFDAKLVGYFTSDVGTINQLVQSRRRSRSQRHSPQSRAHKEGRGMAMAQQVLGGADLGVDQDGGAREFSGSIQGAGSFTKGGTHQLTFSNANTYTGATNVTGGTLRATNFSGSATGTGPVSVQSGATLLVDGGSINSDQLLLANSSTFTMTDGNVTVTNGAAPFDLTVNTAQTSVNFQGGVLDLDGAVAQFANSLHYGGTNLSIQPEFRVRNGALATVGGDLLVAPNVGEFGKATIGNSGGPTSTLNVSGNMVVGGTVAAQGGTASLELNPNALVLVRRQLSSKVGSSALLPSRCRNCDRPDAGDRQCLL